MHNASNIEQFRRRLEDLGCPPRPLRERVRELSDHFEDLKQAALEEGLSETAAEVRASEVLGNPVMLADQLVMAMRRSSWTGRHPVLAFCLLPFFVFPLLWITSGAAGFGLMRLFITAGEWNVLTSDRAATEEILRPLVMTHVHAVMGLTAILFCLLAWRSVLGIKWSVIAGGTCALQSYLFFINLGVRSFSVGYHVGSQIQDLTGPIMALLCCGVVLAWMRIPILWQRRKFSDPDGPSWFGPASA